MKTENLSEADMQFHYFKAHDSDNDDKLDGIELANAMAHYHDEDAGEKPEDYTEHELASMVDQILDEDDLNKDGYIDYPEFIASQKREETEAWGVCVFFAADYILFCRQLDYLAPSAWDFGQKLSYSLATAQP